MRWKGSLAVLAALGLTMLPAPAHAAPSSHPAAGHRTWIAPGVSVNLFSLSTQAKVGSVGHRPKPILTPRITRTPATLQAPVASVAAPQLTGSLLAMVTSFPMISRDAQVAALGQDQNVEPPDTMLAAGPTSLLEMTNSSVSLWTKAGTRIALADLNQVLPMPAGWTFSDPRVLFDTASGVNSGRFFFSGVGFDPIGFSSVVFLGVSKSNDPAGGVFVYKIAQTSNGVLHDQPKIGINFDKVVISWNEFCCGLFSLFVGAVTVVLEKAALLTGSASPMFVSGPNPGQSSPVPTQALIYPASVGATQTEYVTFNGTSFAGVLSITGTPAHNNVVITETDLVTPATSMPPLAMQPGGTINTNDDRFLSSIWQGPTSGVLWVAGNTGCKPPGSATIRSCLRLVKISTSAQAPTLLQAFDAGANGLDVYYPAVTMDPAGNLFIALSGSNSSAFPSAAVLDIAAGAPAGTVSGAAVFQSGAQRYGGSRWGDYSAISIDPATSHIWAAAEYSAAGSVLNWGTAAGEFSF